MFCRRPHAAAAPHTLPSPPPCLDGRLKLSDLEWVADLGEGASGVVTKVRLRGTTTTLFALKLAHYPATTDACKDHDEILRRATGSPHLVRCHAVLRGDDANQPACLLELMDAGSLARLLLPEPALAEVAARCVAGLAHLHARGVAHLDVKPDNILASSQGDAKLADFSVSRVLLQLPACGTNRGSRVVSIAVGTTAYMSPERFAPNAQAGPRGACAADVWSLGITVLELFLGHRPFLPAEDRPSWKMLRDAICEGEPPSVPENAAASPELRRFVAACLHKEPRRRATAAQLLDHPFVAGRNVQASRRALREIIMETVQQQE